MKRFVNGDEIELDETGDAWPLGDRLMIRTPEGTFSAVAAREGDAVLISYKGAQYRIERKTNRIRSASSASSGELRAPMPGQIVDVRVEEGAEVKKGDTLLVLEAMKTQQPFAAPFDGRVKRLPVAKGQQVVDNALLAEVEPL